MPLMIVPTMVFATSGGLFKDIMVLTMRDNYATKMTWPWKTSVEEVLTIMHVSQEQGIPI